MKGFTRHLVRSNKIIHDYKSTPRQSCIELYTLGCAMLSYFLERLSMALLCFWKVPRVAPQLGLAYV